MWILANLQAFEKKKDNTKVKYVSMPDHRECWWTHHSLVSLIFKLDRNIAEDLGAQSVHIHVSPESRERCLPFSGGCWVITASHISYWSLTHKDILLLPKQGQHGQKDSKVFKCRGTGCSLNNELKTLLISKGLETRHLFKWLGAFLSRNWIILTTAWMLFRFNVLYMEIGFSSKKSVVTDFNPIIYLSLIMLSVFLMCPVVVHVLFTSLIDNSATCKYFG